MFQLEQPSSREQTTKFLATGVNEQARFYRIGGFKGGRWYNNQLDKLRSNVIGDLSQRQMITKEHEERNKHLNRAGFIAIDDVDTF